MFDITDLKYQFAIYEYLISLIHRTHSCTKVYPKSFEASEDPSSLTPVLLACIVLLPLRSPGQVVSKSESKR